MRGPMFPRRKRSPFTFSLDEAVFGAHLEDRALMRSFREQDLN